MCKMSSEQGAALSQCVRWFARSHAIATHLGMTLKIEDLIEFFNLNLFPDDAEQDREIRRNRSKWVEQGIKQKMINRKTGELMRKAPNREGAENEDAENAEQKSKDGSKQLQEQAKELNEVWDKIITKTTQEVFDKKSSGARTWEEINMAVDRGASQKPFKIQELVDMVGKLIVEQSGNGERKGGNKKSGKGKIIIMKRKQPRGNCAPVGRCINTWVPAGY